MIDTRQCPVVSHSGFPDLPLYYRSCDKHYRWILNVGFYTRLPTALLHGWPNWVVRVPRLIRRVTLTRVKSHILFLLWHHKKVAQVKHRPGDEQYPAPVVKWRQAAQCGDGIVADDRHQQEADQARWQGDQQEQAEADAG